MAATAPLISMGASQIKRSPRSLFTIEELKTFCKMNNIHYVEDNQIRLNERGNKVIIHNGSNRLVSNRWPVICNKNPEHWYESMRFNALSFQTEFTDVFLYDVVETTLPYQRENNEFYAMTCCAMVVSKYRGDRSNMKVVERMRNTNIYCIKDRGWFRPIIDVSPSWRCCVGFEKI